jgi:hypothetical protein
MYMQDFVPMEADVRVMLIGHKPVCAFWRRPPEGEWLTNTSQGGSMDYQNVPKELLDLAVKVSKAANAEYWACDIAVGKDGKYRILECATAFAAFPYIRDWIGQYLMWKLSNGKFKKPNIPLYNWEELGKIDSSLLRTMRYITFGKYTPSFDGEYFMKKKKATVEGEREVFSLDSLYPMLNTKERKGEEWPSEKWNFQDKYRLKNVKTMEVEIPDSDEGSINTENIDDEAFFEYLSTAAKGKGVGKKKAKKMIKKVGKKELIQTLESNPEKLKEIVNIKNKAVKQLQKGWKKFKQIFQIS